MYILDNTCRDVRYDVSPPGGDAYECDAVISMLHPAQQEVMFVSLRCCVQCLRRRDSPQPRQDGSADGQRVQRSKSWSDVAAAFPVASEAVRMEDIEVGQRSAPLCC